MDLAPLQDGVKFVAVIFSQQTKESYHDQVYQH